ncbi:MAG: hypothetical protein AAGI52_01565 [Bacteroidota bacterium]
MQRLRLPVLLFLLALTAAASAQPLQIREVDVPDAPQPRAGEAVTVNLRVRVENTGRVDRFVIVAAQPDGAPESDRVMSPDRIVPERSATLALPVVIDLRGVTPTPLSIPVTVRAYSNATRIADEETVEIAVADAPTPPADPPQEVIAINVVDLSIPPIQINPVADPMISEIELRVFMGDDDLRGKNNVEVYVLDAAGRTVYRDERDGEWPAGSIRTETLHLPSAVPLSSLHRLVFEADPNGTWGIATNQYDNWNIDRVEVFAGSQMLAREDGAPWHRFTNKHRFRALQLRPPDLAAPVRELGLSIYTADDDMRGGSRVFAQAFGRDGRTLSDRVLLTTGGAGWGEESHRIVPLLLRAAVPARDIGRIVLEHESVRSGPFDGDDDWDLGMIEVLSAFTPGLRNGAWSILHTAQGEPLHRFEGDDRRFEVRLD